MRRQTQAIHHPYARPDAYGALSVPIYNAVAYEFDDAEVMADAFCSRIKAPDYSRVENPTVTNFENRVRALTGATHVTAFGSGMAAIANTLMAVGRAGANIVTSRHLFGNTFALVDRTLRRFGVEGRFVDLTDAAAVADAVDDATCAVYLEILTNPQLEVADLGALAAVAHGAGVPLIADSTAIPFTQFDLHSLGVDVEVVSSTKYISGGATSLGGLVIDYGTFPDVNQRIKYELLFNLGSYMTPQAAYLQTVGLETLDARYRVQSASALDVATRLAAMAARGSSVLRAVNYIGLPDNRYHDLAARQFGPTGGAMLTIDLDSRESCFRFLNSLRLVHRATNLFDNRTLAIHPASTIFGLFAESELAAMDVKQTTIRLSIGLEDPDDIMADIEQALDKS